ncbi:MAG TPA: M14 family metallopeptidase [Steroidobacter sp.]
MSQAAFSRDFASARTRFREAAAAAGASLDSHSYPVSGPSGEDLSTDVAWIGPRDAENVFVTVSGTHGVEGFCGSGAQIDWLSRGEASRLQPTTAAMLVHAINPYGFAWLRRVTHENVDLNRNWIDFSGALPHRLEYDDIARTLCPSEWTDESQAQTLTSLRGYIATHGLPAFVEAVSGGQHHHPQGLFYGGAEPTVARRTLESVIAARLSGAKRVGIVDYHTGLGPFGYGELMLTSSRGSEVYERTRSWYGAAVTPVGGTDSASATIGGDWLSAVPTLLPNALVTGIALEFGTVPVMQVLDALRADNWLHAHGNPEASWPNSIKQQILGAFYVDSDLWRGMVLGQSLAVCRQTIAGLQAHR